MPAIDEILAGMNVLDPSLQYYAITLTADGDGNILVDTQTRWTGYANADRRIEIREASLVRPEALVRYWETQGQAYVVVKNEDEWPLFYMLGGNALVAKNIAEANLGTMLDGDNCVAPVDFGSFISIDPEAA